MKKKTNNIPPQVIALIKQAGWELGKYVFTEQVVPFIKKLFKKKPKANIKAE